MSTVVKYGSGWSTPREMRSGTVLPTSAGLVVPRQDDFAVALGAQAAFIVRGRTSASRFAADVVGASGVRHVVGIGAAGRVLSRVAARATR